MSDLYDYAIFWGGVFRKALVEGWLESQGSIFLLDIILDHPFKDEYWYDASIKDKSESINVPAYHMGGWFDCFYQGNLDAFTIYQNDAGPNAVGRQKLLMGPWTHSGFDTPVQGELIFPLNSMVDYLDLSLQWLDYHLKGIGNIDDIAVRLVDIYPDGRWILICDGIQRASRRNGGFAQDFLSPGVVYPIEVDLRSTSIIINSGHRIGIIISGNNYTRFELNPQTGEDYYDGVTMQPASVLIRLSQDHPSALLLPIPENSTLADPDFNSDGVLDGRDLGILMSHFIHQYPPYDINFDGKINSTDVLLLAGIVESYFLQKKN